MIIQASQRDVQIVHLHLILNERRVNQVEKVVRVTVLAKLQKEIIREAENKVQIPLKSESQAHHQILSLNQENENKVPHLILIPIAQVVKSLRYESKVMPRKKIKRKLNLRHRKK